WPPITTLWVLAESGVEPEQLTDGPMSFGSPWPAENDKIWALGVKPTAELVKYDAAHENYEKVLSGISATDMDFSPDGKWVRYVFGTPDMSINMLDLRTHKITKIAGSDGLFSPRWSPDGRYLVALSLDFTKVMLFDFKTQTWSTWFTDAAGSVSYPLWSSDSK